MIAYRSDIDGLRAVAVCAVVIYHFIASAIPNGYLGVDVFFVISGFLITKIILKELEKDSFTIRSFYERRIKRIMPAFLLVLFVSFIFSYFLFLPPELLSFVKSAVSSLFFSSNIYFYSEVDYFDMQSKLKPLLHTWSLAVEEQFYIFFPLLLIGIFKFKKNSLTFLIWGLLVLSLLAYLYVNIVMDNRDFGFYMFPLRAWELMAGAVLCCNIQKYLPTGLFKLQILSCIGMFLIFSSLFISVSSLHSALKDIMPWSPFASMSIAQFKVFLNIFAVMGTSIVIAVGLVSQQTYIYRLLSLRPAVFIGKISYSFYLWHWPVYVFAMYYCFDDLSKLDKVVLIFLSAFLAFLSWKYVEQPLRKIPSFKEFRKIFFRPAIASILFIVIASTVLISTSGRAHWHKENLLNVSDVKIGGDFKKLTSFNDNSHDVYLGREGTIDEAEILLIGDSHAQAISPAIDEIARQKSMVSISMRNSCLYLPQMLEGLQVSDNVRDCAEKLGLILDYVRKNENLKIIIIALRWKSRTEKLAEQLGVENSNLFREKSLENFIQNLKSSGKRVVLLAQVPLIEYSSQNIPSILARMKMRGIDYKSEMAPNKTEYLKNNASIINILESLEKRQNITVIWPHQYLCQNDICMIDDDEGLLYYDDDHLSNYGAKAMIPFLLENGL